MSSYFEPGGVSGILRIVHRYFANAGLNVNNAVAGTYVDFGGVFTDTVTTMAADQVVVRVQSVIRKVVAGAGGILIDRSGTKLPNTLAGGLTVEISAGASDLSFALELWDIPGAGTFTYKPQVVTSDGNACFAGDGLWCQMLVEVWR